MSGDQKPPDDPIARITQFFADREVRADCPFCGNLTWMLIDTEEFTTSLPVRGGVPVLGMQGHDLYSFVCRKCGFIRTHLRGVVDGTIDLLAPSAEPRPPEEPHNGDGDAT